MLTLIHKRRKNRRKRRRRRTERGTNCLSLQDVTLTQKTTI
jgi:hypothetical protein